MPKSSPSSTTSVATANTISTDTTSLNPIPKVGIRQKPTTPGFKPYESPSAFSSLWKTITNVMPWAFGTGLAVVGGTLLIAVALPKIAALAAAWGLAAKSMVALGYVKAAIGCLVHCINTFYTMMILLQGLVVIGLTKLTAGLGLTAAIIAGSITTLIEATLAAFAVGMTIKAISGGVNRLFGLNKVHPANTAHKSDRTDQAKEAVQGDIKDDQALENPDISRGSELSANANIRQRKI